ncbi:MAG TPA: bifunctional glutamate N-acetyltransferase/amino-acid acetyltransferase ArgJ [Usitatibacter sp.]|nr:bifunctional glutamate N-acetyltransferase/amino-acid acetyltransferase ArgJ [Usitatibacter sp.]
MAVNLTAPEVLHPVKGVRLGAAEAAIKKPGRKDLVLIELARGTRVAGVFTRNAFCAAPVLLCRQALSSDVQIRALLINSGNANAATGAAGMEDGRSSMVAVALHLGLRPDQVLPFSTGVIGVRLPVNRMMDAVPAARASLREDGWLDAARAIMTTDTVPKGATRRLHTSQGEVTVTGIAKGVGMICPDMATLLAFIGTDARLSQKAAQAVLMQAVSRSFNCITVDGDTSTNDSCVLFATGQVGAEEVDEHHGDLAAIARAVTDVCRDLAQSIVRDGEGATKFMTIRVDEAATKPEGFAIAKRIANSPLVKTAFFASDPNLGRILAAIGNAGVANLDASKVSLWLGDVQVVENGGRAPSYTEDQGKAVMQDAEITMRITLGRGIESATVWTCDFSYDYVKINADYRS